MTEINRPTSRGQCEWWQGRVCPHRTHRKGTRHGGRATRSLHMHYRCINTINVCRSCSKITVNCLSDHFSHRSLFNVWFSKNTHIERNNTKIETGRITTWGTMPLVVQNKIKIKSFVGQREWQTREVNWNHDSKRHRYWGSRIGFKDVFIYFKDNKTKAKYRIYKNNWFFIPLVKVHPKEGVTAQWRLVSKNAGNRHLF